MCEGSMGRITCRTVEKRGDFLIVGPGGMRQNDRVKKFFAIIVAAVSAWVLFTPFDLGPAPFLFFIDEAIALVLFTKSMSYLGIDIARFLPFLQSRKRKNGPAGNTNDGFSSANEPVIDV